MKRLTMKEGRTLVKGFAGQYRKASKKEKGTILDRFIEAAAYQRHYAARLLRSHGLGSRLSVGSDGRKTPLSRAATLASPGRPPLARRSPASPPRP